jgi:hypothetical protein
VAATTLGLPPGILYSILEDPNRLQAYQHLAVYKEGRRPVDASVQAFLEVSAHQRFVAGVLIIALEPWCVQAGPPGQRDEILAAVARELAVVEQVVVLPEPALGLCGTGRHGGVHRLLSPVGEVPPFDP